MKKHHITKPIENGRNVEIKARTRNWNKLNKNVRQKSDGPGTLIRQADTFFYVMRGRLKLRQIDHGYGELSYYQREDSGGPRMSNYQIFPTEDPLTLLGLMTSAMGVRGVIAKTRHLFWIGQTRIHLDEVDGLGRFIELEAVLRPDQTESDGKEIVHGILEQLCIDKQEVIDCAYIDLLESARRTTAQIK